MADTVEYNGHEITSTPQELADNQFKAQAHVFLHRGRGRKIQETVLNGSNVYNNHEAAYLAGVAAGRAFIDQEESAA